MHAITIASREFRGPANRRTSQNSESTPIQAILAPSFRYSSWSKRGHGGLYETANRHASEQKMLFFTPELMVVAIVNDR
jgi:hypothetical protein